MDKFENDAIMKIGFISLDNKNNHIILGLELMENGSLLKYITAENEIRTKQAIEWAYNIAEGLHYLHSTQNAKGFKNIYISFLAWYFKQKSTIL